MRSSSQSFRTLPLPDQFQFMRFSQTPTMSAHWKMILDEGQFSAKGPRLLESSQHLFPYRNVEANGK